MDLSILYRGPLSSCNYACSYCPFAKRRETTRELADDRAALARFVDWVEQHPQVTLGVLFTPWGEALVRRWYREALVRLTALPHMRRAAIQTNLSGPLDWIDRCDKRRLALWATFHPSETTRARFVARCRRLVAAGVRMSVGTVGLRENLDEIQALRDELPQDVYLWVNAYKQQLDYYTGAEEAMLTAVDPLFPLNNQRHASRGHLCHAGHRAISVDGSGTMRRCHFLAEPIGNLYRDDWPAALQPRACPAERCGCHIGYVHLDRLSLDRVFGDGILERIPVAYPADLISISRSTDGSPAANVG